MSRYDEQLPLGGTTTYLINPAHVVVYAGPENQVDTAGPGLERFTCPMIQLSRTEVAEFATKIQKACPNEEVRVLYGGPDVGTGIFGVKAV